jgi:hypothetical protein
MRILLGLIIVAFCASPALAGKHHNDRKNDNHIANLEAKLDHVFMTPSPDRQEQIDKLERALAYELFKDRQRDN